MPKRKDPILTNSTYHVFNKTIDSKNIFNNVDNCVHFIDLIKYYRSTDARVSFSKLKELGESVRKGILDGVLQEENFKVEIYSYNLMPTHFHLLIKQQRDRGIERFIADITNALTRYYNLKNERKGPIFQETYKAVSIRSQEQLIHVSRYIHLNIYSSGIVNNYKELSKYPWSSYKEYLHDLKSGICNTDPILSYFKTKERYKKFVGNNADYQRKLEYIKHTRKWFGGSTHNP